jgi:hypothetical protein
LGSAYRFGVKAINVESAALESMPGFDVGKRDGRVAHLVGQGSAAIPATSPPAVAQPQTGPRILPKDLAEVFGTSGVTATFNAVHAFLQTCNNGNAEDRRERIAQRIMLGDWVDLPHLTVLGDAGGGAINTNNVDLGGGKLLRLIVVGIDSFGKTNKNAPAHVVFQFQNIPGTHRMNPWDSSYGGYKESEMRLYLTRNFLRGLVAAGVPEGLLYAPTRYISNGNKYTPAADALADWLWLPTEWELKDFQFGSNDILETAANQSRLEYYDERVKWGKYIRNGRYQWYWLASPDRWEGSMFCASFYPDNEMTGVTDASSMGGVAPAFCVK